MQTKKETILKVIKITDKGTKESSLSVEARKMEASVLLSLIVNLLGKFSALSGISYNEILDDIKEIQEDPSMVLEKESENS
ncbi:MAG: hypothetical protein JHC33_03410 [Ignisphaera sp.]|nr:hypothetical protein [Ignisphaera sp.]